MAKIWGRDHKENTPHPLNILNPSSPQQCPELYQARGKQQLVCWEQPNHPHVWWFTRRFHRTQHTVPLTAMIYYSGRILSKISKGITYMGSSLGKTNSRLTWFLSQWRYTECVLSWVLHQWLWVVTKHAKFHLPEKLIRDSISRIFTGGW